MLDNIKHLMSLKSVDKNIAENNFDEALEKLNYLIREEFKPSETFVKRGRLCKKLLMYDDAYSDFTYVINHCVKKEEAYYERVFLNYEISNYYEAILDANTILEFDSDNFDVKRIKFLSLVYSSQNDVAKEYLAELFENNKYKSIQFLFNEVAFVLASDEFAKALKILDLIDLIDKDNPIKLLKEANIYALAGEKNKEEELLLKIENTFPKYFVSHFRFTDMYETKDLLETCFLLELKIFDKEGLFLYPMEVLSGYKNYLEGHIIDAKECFEKAISYNPHKPEAYVLLGQTLQLMSGYNNDDCRVKAEENYRTALDIYLKEGLSDKAEKMRRQIKHLNSNLTLR